MQHIDLNAAKAAKASDRKSLAILAYDNATADPAGANWRGVAELLRLALGTVKAKAVVTETDSRFAPRADYDIPQNATKRLGKSPIVIVSFADGETVRVPAVSLPGKPVNIGRALRVAVSFYQGRIVSRYNSLIPNNFGTLRLSICDSEFVGTIPVPAVVSAICETTGAEYDPAACSAMVAALRPVAPSQAESPVAPLEYTDFDAVAAFNWLQRRLLVRQGIGDCKYPNRMVYAVMTLWPDLADSELTTAVPVTPDFRPPSRFLASSAIVRDISRLPVAPSCILRAA